MPFATPHTKAERRNIVSQEMHRWGQGKLHSGSPTGPKVKSQKQAVAIALSEAGLARKAIGGEVAPAFHAMSPREKATSGLLSRPSAGRFPKPRSGPGEAEPAFHAMSPREMATSGLHSYVGHSGLERGEGGRFLPRRQAGGGIDPSGSAVNPLELSQMQRYQALPSWQLQGLAQAPGTTGTIARSVLQNKERSEGIAPAATNVALGYGMADGGDVIPFRPKRTYRDAFGPPPYIGPLYRPFDYQEMEPHILQRLLEDEPANERASGGLIPHRQFGGFSPAEAVPGFERHPMQATTGGTGFLLGATPGRADQVNVSPPAGSYVWPADVIAGVGEGNSLAGAAILERALRTGPHGTPLPPGRRGPGIGIPRPPPRFQTPLLGPPAQHGGRVDKGGGEGEPTEIMAAHGELISPPHIARLWGRGNLKKGHEVFDKAVLELRAKHIEDQKKLKGPVKS